MAKTIREFPKLFSKDSSGKGKWWTIQVFTPAKTSSATIITEYAGDGEKVRHEEKEITVGKNIGRKNETTPFEQACSEAESTWKKKIDKGYVVDIDDINDKILLPMLALKFEERKHNISYPAFVQPKLDGVRVLVEKVDSKTIKYLSRMGKPYTTLEHLTVSLLGLMEIGEVWDGEVYSHDITFQQMTSYVKKLRPESSELDIWFFDIADDSHYFETRYKTLRQRLKSNKNPHIKLVDCYEVQTEKFIHEYHDIFIREGYEGIMIRNAQGNYKFKDRSPDLQKLKMFQDDEFEIIGGEPGTGSEAGCVVFECKNKSKQTFKVRPRGSFELRKRWMKDIKKLKGKKLTVRYQEFSDEGIPRFPVGIAIRDYE